MSGKDRDPPGSNDPPADHADQAGGDALPDAPGPQGDITLEGGAPQIVEIPREEIARRVRTYLAARRQRDALLGPGWFQDPAWDMLLDLLACRHENISITVTSACVAAAVPATTALRWLKGLVDNGAIVRKVDPVDRRRVYVEINLDLAARLEAWVTTCLPPSGA